MKKVCVVTASRSEYGLLRWVINGIHHHPDLELQLVVTGTHLVEEQGLTYKLIEADGYPISAKVDMHLNSQSQDSIAKSMGWCVLGMADVLTNLQPDILVVLGDRYELMSICSTALVLNIPIAHISGGDVTIGAIDNEVRNAVTMMATLHFPGVIESAQNIVRMRGSEKHVWTVGEPGLDNFKRMDLMSRIELSEDIGIPTSNMWILVTLHPETQQSLEYNLKIAENIVCLTDSLRNTSVVISKANADYGGVQINEYWERVTKANPQKYHLYASLGQKRYLSFMNECDAVLGNSSSGIVEAPCLGTPVINIGDRQTGRHLCINVRQVDNIKEEIMSAWHDIEHCTGRQKDYYWGDGNTSDKIVKQIVDYLYE